MDETPFRDLYPFEPHYLYLDGLRYHYLDEGPRDAPVLLMLHGNPTWSFYYRDLVLGLRDRFRCIVPDHIGCGRSAKPRAYPYRLATHIANVQCLLAELRVERYHLACHDWGGPIGLGVAIEAPDQLDKLVVFNTTCLVTPRYPTRILICKTPGLGAAAIRGLGLFNETAVRLACCRRERMTPAVRAGYLAPYDSWANRVAVHSFVQDIPLGPAHPSWASAKRVESRLHLLQDKPMLICWGRQDFCFDDYFLVAWRIAFPASEVALFEDAGHYVVEDAHERILPLIRRHLVESSNA